MAALISSRRTSFRISLAEMTVYIGDHKESDIVTQFAGSKSTCLDLNRVERMDGTCQRGCQTSNLHDQTRHYGRPCGLAEAD